MKTRKRLIFKTLIVMLLTILTAGLICLPNIQSFASGTINVTLSSIEGLDTEGFDGFTFKLYRVGSIDGQYFKLEPDYDDVNVRIPPKEKYEGDSTWEQEWLDSAATLANHIEHPAEGAEPPAPVETFTNVKPGNEMSYSSSENGLFLLIGSSERVGNQIWKPVPMFVRILNSKDNYTIDGSLKVKATPIVFKHSLKKVFDPEDAGGIKPQTIEVGLYFGEGENSQLIDTITLGVNGDSEVWNYYWESEEAGEKYYYIHEDENGETVREEFTPVDRDGTWSVKEIVDIDEMKSDAAKESYKYLRFFSPTYSTESDEDQTFFTITNKLAFKSLELTKEIDGYDIDDQNITFPFLITGKDSTGKVVYTNHVGVAFVRNGELVSEPTKIEYIPKEVVTITVEEEYSANYEQVGEPEITFDSDSNIWKIHVKNKHTGHGPKSGVVNKYKHDQEEPEQQGI